MVNKPLLVQHLSVWVVELHLVPQLLKHAELGASVLLEGDPFGQSFLERIAKTPDRIRDARLKKIESALRACVPNMRDLKFSRDNATGTPHLEALYEHWRPDAGWQREDQFSDGTLRLLGPRWAVEDGPGFVQLAAIVARVETGVLLLDALASGLPLEQAAKRASDGVYEALLKG